MNSKLALFAILLFATVTRLIALGSTPPSLNWDEVSHGYNAYSILQNGTDEWGERFPIIFRAYGDYKLPVYIYLTAISERIFGINEFAVRLPGALAGIVSVIFTYLLSNKVVKNKSIALLAALLIAISPWSFFLSRGAFEANVALTLIISGVYYWLIGVERKNKMIILGVMLLGLSVWTYNSARLFVPLLLFAGHVVYLKDLKGLLKSRLLVSGYLLLTIFFFLPMFYQLLNPIGSARYDAVKILEAGAISRIEEQRNMSQLPEIIEKIAFNKVVYFSQVFLGNYIQYFSPEFLFLSGGSHYQFSIPGRGLLYIVTFPFLVIGVLFVLKRSSLDKEYRLVLIWLFVAPIAASVTREQMHVLRSIVMLPIPVFLIAIGFWEFVRRLQRVRVVFSVFIILLLLSFFDYARVYAIEYEHDYSWSWQYGYKDIVQYSMKNYKEYDKIIVTKKYGEPHEFVLFYSKWEPERYLKDSQLNRFYQSDWYWVDSFDKFYFVNDWEIPVSNSQIFSLESGQTVDCEKDKCLLITSPANAPENWVKLKTTSFLDGKPAFEIYENK
jgi:4-amino-4-deoxy-L-arabinose transferase-like glycosyltransferase